MNNGKICVPVCARTAEDLIKNIEKAVEIADVVEVRFDCLDADQIDISLSGIAERNFATSLLATFRPREQGGKRDLTKAERINFWSKANGHFGFADLEEGAVEFNAEAETRIISFHDFSGVPDDIHQIYDRLCEAPVDVIKIAVQADDITDSIAIWKLLDRATSENRQIIPIAMGEAGKWTRILGLAHGALLTYASLGSGDETAPGQVAVNDMTDVFRVKELDKNTAVYGIVGGNTSYSMSPYMHNTAFKARKLNSVFVPLQVRDLDEFIRRMVKPESREIDLNFRGFSVTMPHKNSISRHLNDIDETAKRIGAVNTVKIKDGRLYGYNTDAGGFIAPLKNAFAELRDARVAIFGAGGAARACISALKQKRAEVTVFVRDTVRSAKLGSEFEIEVCKLTTDRRPPATVFSDFDIIVNATPLGTKGDLADASILTAEQLAHVKLVYDLVYNPSETRLMREARMAGVKTIGGLEMLVAQGAEQFRIWTGSDAPVDEMKKAAIAKLSR